MNINLEKCLWEKIWNYLSNENMWDDMTSEEEDAFTELMDQLDSELEE